MVKIFLDLLNLIRSINVIVTVIIVFAELKSTYSDNQTTASHFFHRSIYHGMRCHTSSFLPNCNQIFPRLCIGGSDCVLWESGTFPFHMSINNTKVVDAAKSSYTSSITNCSRISMKSRKCKTFRGGRFFNGIWSTKECDFPVQHGHDFRNRLSGRHIILIGNSIIRQVFNRLVWHCREIDEVIEHFYHTDAFYVFNSTHDYFGIGGTYSSSTCDLLNPIFIADYKWDNTGSYLQNPDKVDADLRVIGTTYFNFVAAKVIDQMKNISNSSTLFLTMPIVEWKPRRKNVVHGNLSEINSWIESENIYYLPLSEMANTLVFRKNVLDDLHFQCSFMTLSHKQVDYNIKMPANGDCRDIINLNIVMMLAYHLQFLPCPT